MRDLINFDGMFIFVRHLKYVHTMCEYLSVSGFS